MPGNHNKPRAVPEGARLTFEQLSELPPRYAVKEEYEPVLHDAVLNPKLTILLSPDALPDDTPPEPFLVRKIDPPHCYVKDDSKEPKLLGHTKQGRWGLVYFAVICPRVGHDYVFQAPSVPSVSFVAIKQLNKRVVDKYLREGGHENPYREICRMEELGDNVHVLKCIEALEDEDFLYIVTPMAFQQRTLLNAVEDGPLPLERVRSIFSQMCDILIYLHEHRICHRDLSPDNFLFLTPDRLVVFDLAMSQRVPVNEETGTRYHMKPREKEGYFGTREVMAPEIFNRLPFDGLGSDLWSVMVNLYVLLTSHPLYEKPGWEDIAFRYLICAKVMTNDRLNELACEIESNYLQGPFSSRQQAILHHRCMAHLGMTASAKSLIMSVLDIDMARRWTLAQVIENHHLLDDDAM